MPDLSDVPWAIQQVQAGLGWLHEFTGLPWYATIMLTTIAVRTAFVPFVVHQLRATNRYMVDAKPKSSKMWELYMTSIGSKSKFVERPGARKTLDATLLYARGMRALFRKYRCNPASMFMGSL